MEITTNTMQFNTESITLSPPKRRPTIRTQTNSTTTTYIIKAFNTSLFHTLSFIAFIATVSTAKSITVLPPELVEASMTYLSPSTQMHCVQYTCKLFHQCWKQSNSKVLEDAQYLMNISEMINAQRFSDRTVSKLYQIHDEYSLNFNTLFFCKSAKFMDKITRLRVLSKTGQSNYIRIIDSLISVNLRTIETLTDDYFDYGSSKSTDHNVLISLKYLYFCIKKTHPNTTANSSITEEEWELWMRKYTIIKWYHAVIDNPLLYKNDVHMFIRIIDPILDSELSFQFVFNVVGRFTVHFLEHFTVELQENDAKTISFVHTIHSIMIILDHFSSYEWIERIICVLNKYHENAKVILNGDNFIRGAMYASSNQAKLVSTLLTPLINVSKTNLINVSNTLYQQIKVIGEWFVLYMKCAAESVTIEPKTMKLIEIVDIAVLDELRLVFQKYVFYDKALQWDWLSITYLILWNVN